MHLTISRSTSEAEYQALASTVCELQWLTYLFLDFNVEFITFALLYCNNQSTRHVVAITTFYERTKHFEIDYHIM